MAGPLGKRFGVYAIEGELARGGQGAVWRARHAETGQLVALKLLLSASPSAAKRFAQEARVLARLSHPNLLRVFDYGEVSGTPYLAMELVAGEDLNAVLQRGLPDPAWSARAVGSVAGAVEHCHENGIIHRDLKPANVVLEQASGRLVLIDFGLVKRDPGQMELSSVDGLSQFSQSGSVKGTPEYLAPEQVSEREFGEISPATDVYGLGATLYHLLTGQPPFEADSAVVVFRKVTRKAPEAPAKLNPNVPRQLSDFCLRCLSKQPSSRPPSASAFASELAAALGLSGVVVPSLTGSSTERSVLTAETASSESRPASSAGTARFSLPTRGPTTGARLGPYQVVRELGRGGMGVVLEAVHERSGARAAVKVLTTAGSASGTKRFQRETQALKALAHPHIVRYHDAGDGPPAWLAMDFVEGGDLHDQLHGGALLPADETARILAQVAQAIAHAHQAGIVHRDLKPANVLMRAADGAALVTDFGLARSLDASRFTQTGTTLGTLAFMSPEQARGETSSFPTDVWAIGVVLYRCLTGENPFVADSSFGLVGQIIEGKFKSPRALNPDVPTDLESVCLRCLQRDPAERPSAADVAAALADRLPLGAVPSPRKATWVVGSAATLVLAGLLATWGLRAPAEPGLGPSVAPSASPSAEGSESLGSSPGEAPAEAAGPWPSLGWTRSWRLGDNAPPQLSPPELWSGDEGREAAPLAALRDAKAGEALPGFLGSATSLGEGRAQVRYRDLVKALQLEFSAPGNYFLCAEHGRDAVVRSRRAGQASVRCANDMEAVRLQLGTTQWEAPELRARLREPERVDNRRVYLRLGSGPESPGLTLSFSGRSGRVSFQRVHLQRALSSQWLSVLFAPGAAPGARVRFEDQALREFDSKAEESAPTGYVVIEANEVHLGLEGVEVRGRPLRPDLPALAWLPQQSQAPTRVAASFRYGEGGSPKGGPLLGLATDGQRGLWLEVDGARVVLRRDRYPLASVALDALPQAGAEGWLSLWRDADVVRGRVHWKDSGETAELNACDPLPLGAPARACYGSSAPRIRFARVELEIGPRDDARAAFERAFALGDDLPQARSPRERTWGAALRLAQVARPRWAKASLVGASGRAARVAQGQEAAQALERAANDLSFDARRHDALARALLAYVIAADRKGAVRCAERLSKDAGLTSAVALVDRLHASAGRPALIKRLVAGYCSVYDTAVREAGLHAALVLVPEEEAQILYMLAVGIRTRQPRPSPRDPAGRRALEEALTLLGRARSAGYPKAVNLDSTEAHYLMDLGRYREALSRLNSNVRARAYWFDWQQRTACHQALGNAREALESALGLVALATQRRGVPGLLQQALRAVNAREHPGLVAVAALILGELSRESSLVAQAVELATKVAQTPGAEGDLAAYTLLRAGKMAPERTGSSPTALLVQARAQGSGSRDRLPSAALKDLLVLSLCRSDPVLEPRLR